MKTLIIAEPMKATRSSIFVADLVCSGQPTQSLEFLLGDRHYLKRGIERCDLRVTKRHRERVLEFRWQSIS
jgi:hypothetical protein